MQGLLCCENIPLMLPQVLGKCLHVQVLPLHTVLHTLAEPDQEDGEHQGDDEGVYSLLDIGFIQLKINLHTNLPLDAVLRKSSFHLLRKRENSKGYATQCKEYHPVKRIKQLEINFSILNQSSVRIFYKDKPIRNMNYVVKIHIT